MPLALLSVSNKTGLVDFARGLSQLGWDLVSTGGTAKALRAGGLTVRDVSDLTGFPEMLDGRVKTLHPVVHGGLLAKRDDPEHMRVAAEHGIAPIDLVVVNLYPFQATAARPGVTQAEVIENIDIGGPSMLRSAAKNFQSVTVVVDPADYARVLATLEAKDDDLDLRRLLAEKVFAHTAEYDAAISKWFACEREEEFPDMTVMAFERAQTLRYGENPGQRAAFYVERHRKGLSGLTQKGGKELSFNNLLDLEGALLATDPFANETCCAIVKHTTPCGLATGTSAVDAYRKALACDPVSAFGSVISFTVPVDAETAEAVSSLFVECIVAPRARGTRRVGRSCARLQEGAWGLSRAGTREAHRCGRCMDGRDKAAANRRGESQSGFRVARCGKRKIKRDTHCEGWRYNRDRCWTDVTRGRRVSLGAQGTAGRP